MNFKGVCWIVLVVIGVTVISGNPLQPQTPRIGRSKGTQNRLLSVGANCHNSDQKGICKLVTKCVPAIQSLEATRTHEFTRCGFDHNTEIVCCPELSSRSPITSKRSSAAACDEYQRHSSLPVSFLILNGKEAEEGEFPHMAALGFHHESENTISFDCGGTLISEQWVLTAAHCFRKNKLVVVRLGTNVAPNRLDRIDPKLDYNVSSFVAHSDYNWISKLNDIALVKLVRKVEFSSFVLPACLHDQPEIPDKFTVSGWGITQVAGDRSEKLMKANLRKFPLGECNSTFQAKVQKNILRSQICAIDDKSDACEGDSGGPIQVPLTNGTNIYIVLGVTSNGIGCGSKYAGVYARVYSYLDWIEDHVWSPRTDSRHPEFESREEKEDNSDEGKIRFPD